MLSTTTTSSAAVLVLALISNVMQTSHVLGQSQEIQQLPIDECSFCADGSMPDTTNISSTYSFAISSTASLTCQDLPTSAVTLLDFGLTNTDFQCETSQLWAYEYCGCPTPPDIRPCWICYDGDENYDHDRWVPGSAGSGSSAEGTCRFQAYFSGLRYDHFGRASDSIELKCPHMIWGMDSWCGCPAENVTQPECTLCGHGKRSPDPCRANPLASKLHASTGQPVGPSFGTCQYYDWIVERLQGPQCGVFEEDSSIQFENFDVRSFCCDESGELDPSSGVSLCETNNAPLPRAKFQGVVPPLGSTCAEVAAVARWLQTDTVLTEPWSGLDGDVSLREFCCNEDTIWDVAGDDSVSPNWTCLEIPRAMYDKPASSTCSSSNWNIQSIFYGLVLFLVLL